MLKLALHGGIPFSAGTFRATLARSFAVTVFSSWIYVGLEWLFFVTKPSLLEFEPLSGRLQVLASAPLPLIVASLSAGLLPLLLVRLARRERQVRALLLLALLLPGFLAAGTILLLVENFTYTLFHFTVLSSRGWTRPVYAAGFAVVWICAGWLMARWVSPAAERKIWNAATVSALVLTLVSAAAAAAGAVGSPGQPRRESIHLVNPPDIFLFGSDGIVTDHLSGFGYSRPTTPFIDQWMQSALVFENALTNGAGTLVALASLFTGKLPMHSRVIIRPDVFRGAAAYEHLPGILRAAGYKSISLGLRNHADPFDLNMIDGFDRAIGNRSDSVRTATVSRRLSGFLGEAGALFLRESGERLLTRAGHISGITRGANWQEDVRAKRRRKLVTDGNRMRELFKFLKSKRGPVFAHVHLMASHGRRFTPRQRVFSAGQRKLPDWNDDEYDDSIRDFDDNVKKVIGRQKARGRYENTIFIVYSDHGKYWSAKDRVPLIIRFPGDAHKDRRRENVQLADVAPTILAYLGVPIPGWMDGISLISAPVVEDRTIFFAGKRWENRGPGGKVIPVIKPPFFTLGNVGMTRCDYHYELSVDTGKLDLIRVAGHTRPCAEPPFTESEARAVLLEKLEESGYQTEGIPPGPE